VVGGAQRGAKAMLCVKGGDAFFAEKQAQPASPPDLAPLKVAR
jgi:hypothetical protein